MLISSSIILLLDSSGVILHHSQFKWSLLILCWTLVQLLSSSTVWKKVSSDWLPVSNRITDQHVGGASVL